MIDNKFLFGVSAFLAFFIVYSLLRSSSQPTGYEVELKEILESDKYKVKGRYE